MTAEEIVPETDAEKAQKDELRRILQHIEDCSSSFTATYFSIEDKELLAEQVKIWRWYISHGWFPKPYQDRKKPSLAWLLQELKAFPRVWDSASLLAAPGMPDSIHMEQAAATLKHQMRRVLDYPGEVQPIPSTFNLPKSDPRKTDQYGVPWAKSECEAARNWRKAQARSQRELEERIRPPKTVYVKTPEEVKADLELKNKQREDAKERHAKQKVQAEAQWQQIKKERERLRR